MFCLSYFYSRSFETQPRIAFAPRDEFPSRKNNFHLLRHGAQNIYVSFGQTLNPKKFGPIHKEPTSPSAAQSRVAS